MQYVCTNNVCISPESTKLIQVDLKFVSPSVIAEKNYCNREMLQIIYGCPEMIIQEKCPRIYISNFSKFPITIQKGEIVSYALCPEKTLAKRTDLTDQQCNTLEAHAQLIRSLDQAKQPSFNYGRANVNKLTDMTKRIIENDRPGETALEGGPKTAETPEDFTDEATFLQQLDINPDLSEKERNILSHTILQRKNIFGIDGRLGNYPGEVEVLLKEGTKPISIPPFNASPEKRAIIDKQMDSWLSLGVIEASKSPWAALFLLYNGIINREW